VLRARSLAEARLYIANEPCATCGADGFSAPSRMVERGEQLGMACDGYCPRCGAARAFALELGDARVPPDAWGGTDPSTLIDAGEWLVLAETWASRAPATGPSAELARAIAALGEVLKFYPPGDDLPPKHAFFTARGRRAYLADPARFERAQIEIVLGAWRELAAGVRTI